MDIRAGCADASAEENSLHMDAIFSTDILKAAAVSNVNTDVLIAQVGRKPLQSMFLGNVCWAAATILVIKITKTMEDAEFQFADAG